MCSGVRGGVTVGVGDGNRGEGEVEVRLVEGKRADLECRECE